MKISIPWPLISIPKYRIILQDEFFFAQCRNSLFNKWQNISSSDHNKLVSDDHWVARHNSLESARATIRARKLFNELAVLNKMRKNYKEYL